MFPAIFTKPLSDHRSNPTSAFRTWVRRDNSTDAWRLQNSYGSRYPKSLLYYTKLVIGLLVGDKSKKHYQIDRFCILNKIASCESKRQMNFSYSPWLQYHIIRVNCCCSPKNLSETQSCRTWLEALSSCCPFSWELGTLGPAHQFQKVAIHCTSCISFLF